MNRRAAFLTQYFTVPHLVHTDSARTPKNVDDSADPDDFYFDFDDAAIANMTGEPINY